jgi:hypothetical protein
LLAISDSGLAPPPAPGYSRGSDDTSIVAFLYLKAIPMPASIPAPQPASAAPALSVDLFMDRVIHSARRHEARAQRAEQATGEPFSYNLSDTASFTGLPVRRLRRLCRDGRIQAFKLSGCWLIHRDEFMRLLAPQPADIAQEELVERLCELAMLLHRHEAACTISVLVNGIRRAVQARREGAAYDDAEGFAWRRAEWRVRYGVVDASRVEDALRLLRTIILLGMELPVRLDWFAEPAMLISMLAAQSGLDLAL